MSDLKQEKRNGKGINRRTFMKVSGMATGAALFGGFHFVRKSSAAEGPIKLGFPVPLTGPYGTEARDQVAGAELAVAQINASGGVLGRKVELLVRDDKLKADEAARQVKILIENDGIHLAAGALSAANQLAANEQCKLHGIPWMAVSVGNEITKLPDNSVYTYDEAVDTHAIVQVSGTWVAKNWGKKWYLLVADYAYGWQMIEGLGRIGKELGVVEVGMTKHPVGASDYSSYMSRILAAKPDVLFLCNFGKDTANSVKQAASFGLKKKMHIYVPAMSMSARLSGGDEDFDGVAGGCAFYWELDRPSAKEFVQAFRKMHNRLPVDYAGYAYSGVKELLSGVNRAGSLDPLALATAIEGRTYDNYKGSQWWRPCDHNSQQDWFIIRSKKAKAQYDVFDIIDTVSGSKGKLMRPCAELGLDANKPIRVGLIKR